MDVRSLSTLWVSLIRCSRVFRWQQCFQSARLRRSEELSDEARQSVEIQKASPAEITPMGRRGAM